MKLNKQLFKRASTYTTLATGIAQVVSMNAHALGLNETLANALVAICLVVTVCCQVITFKAKEPT